MPINGDDGNNTLNGTPGPDEINGFGGNDTINGGDGDDVIDGGTGNDKLTGGLGNDRFVFTRGMGADTLPDFTVGDKIDLTAFNIADFSVLAPYLTNSVGTSTPSIIQFLYNGVYEIVSVFRSTHPGQLTSADFVFNTSTAPLVVQGTAGQDYLFGGNGDDTITGGAGDDRLTGGGGNDRFVFTRGMGWDTVYDFTAGDKIDVSAFNIVNLSTLKDYLFQDGPNAYIRLMYNGQQEVIYLNKVVADQLTSNDFIFNTSTTPLVVQGTTRQDYLFGGNGDDQIYTSGGDIVRAGGGADRFYVGAGDATLNGDAGIDTYYITTRDMGAVVINDWQPGEHIDLSGIDIGDYAMLQKLMGTDGPDVLINAWYHKDFATDHLDYAGSIRIKNVTIEQLGQSTFIFNLRTDDQTLTGGSGNAPDILWGGAGNDQLNGLFSNDRLYGEAGNDRLDGGMGSDLLYGGTGADVFVWSSYHNNNNDTINDFSAGDRIDVSSIGISNIDQLRSHLVQNGTSGQLVLANSISNETLTILNFDVASATADQFILRTGTDNQTITGTYDGDDLFGGNGNDTINGLLGRDHIDGGNGDDTIDGGDDSDWLNGGAGNDTIAGRTGNDVIDGGTGIDTAVYVFTQAEYDISYLSDGSIVVDGGGNDVDLLHNIERLQFSDGTITVGAGTPSIGNPTPVLHAFGANYDGGSWSSDGLYPRAAADINGDGRADIVGFGSAGVYASLAQADGSFGPIYLAINGYGASDAAGGWSTDDRFLRQLADVNGDGRADIVGFGGAGTYVSLANVDGTFGNAFLANPNFGTSDAAGGWTSNDRYPREMGDVNGDGRADIVGFGALGTYVALAQADGHFGSYFLASNLFGTSTSAGSWASDDRYPRMLGDVNGDGRDDIVGFGSGGTYVALANVDGTFASPTLATSHFGVADGWPSDTLTPRALGDFNGDGLADLVGFGANGVMIGFNNGDGSFADPVLALNSFGSSTNAGGWTSDDTYPRLVADMDGNGLSDIVGFGGSWVYVADTTYHF